MDKLERLASPKHQELIKKLDDVKADIAKNAKEREKLDDNLAMAIRDLSCHVKKPNRKALYISLFVAFLATVSFGFEVVKFSDEAQLHIDEIIPKFFGKNS